MKGFVVRKVSAAVLTIYIIVCFNFVLFRMVPGDPVRLMFHDPRIPSASLEHLYERFGLTGSLWDQFVAYQRQLFIYGDLGLSFARKLPVSEVIAGKIPKTLLMVVTALIIASVVGTALGAIAGWKTGTKFDTVIVSFSLTTYAIPTFAMGILLMMIFALHLGILPLRGMETIESGLTGWAYFKDVVSHMVLPVTSISVWYIGGYVIITRNSMQDVLDQDYITLARAKGIKESAVLRRHALRNAILPVVTMLGVHVGWAVAGVIQAETVFGWPGVGRLMYTSVMARDYPVLQGLFLLFSVILVLANLVVDLIYGYIDPRIKVGGE